MHFTQPLNLRRHTERTLKSCKVVLASGSPRRKDLLQEMGIDIEILVPEVDVEAVVLEAGDTLLETAVRERDRLVFRQERA